MQDKRRRDRIDLKMLFLVDDVPDRECTAVLHGFQRVFGLSAHDLFRKIG